MTDYLAALPVEKVEAWYRRLVAKGMGLRVRGRIPYAAMMLEKYLDNRDPTRTYKMPMHGYLPSFHKVTDVLAYHRRVFLSQEAARVDRKKRFVFSVPVTKLVGIVPRLKGKGYPKWNFQTPLALDYHSLVQIDDNPVDAERIQNFGSPIEQDLFGSLRGFQLHSKVVLRGTALDKTGAKVRVDSSRGRRASRTATTGSTPST